MRRSWVAEQSLTWNVKYGVLINRKEGGAHSRTMGLGELGRADVIVSYATNLLERILLIRREEADWQAEPDSGEA